MKIELDSRPDGIGVSFRHRAPALLDSFKLAVAAGARRYDPAARQWVVRQSHYCWLLLWGAQAQREFGAAFEDRVRLRGGQSAAPARRAADCPARGPAVAAPGERAALPVRLPLKIQSRKTERPIEPGENIPC